MRKQKQTALTKAVKTLKCYEWLRDEQVEKVHVGHSNAIMSCKNYKDNYLINFRMRMRRKLLPENGRRSEKAGNKYFEKRFRGAPETDKCPLCGEVENRAHVMTSCPHTLFIRQQTVRKIKEKIREATGIDVSEVPCWWGTDGEPTTGWDDIKNLNKVWGAMGIIPDQLSAWIAFKTKATGKIRDDLIAEIQLEILKGSHESWEYRKKKLRA